MHVFVCLDCLYESGCKHDLGSIFATLGPILIARSKIPLTNVTIVIKDIVFCSSTPESPVAGCGGRLGV